MGPGHTGANSGLHAKVTTRHQAKAQFDDVTRPVEVLIRELVAQADKGADHSGNENNDGNGQVIIDAEVDGIRCVLTRLQQTAPTFRVSFSPREREIARMVAQGYPNKAIAAVLEISSWTVCTHLRRIFAKLRVSSRAAMVARMMDTGILSRPPK